VEIFIAIHTSVEAVNGGVAVSATRGTMLPLDVIGIRNHVLADSAAALEFSRVVTTFLVYYPTAALVITCTGDFCFGPAKIAVGIQWYFAYALDANRCSNF
jgi:hypothetical protein